MENELQKKLTIDDLRAVLVDFYRSMDVPCTMHEIVEMLKKNFDEYVNCGCGFCMLKAGGVAETVIVIEECAKLLPQTRHNAIAGLMVRFHLSRLECLKKLRDAADDKISNISKGKDGQPKFIEVTGETALKLMEMLSPMLGCGDSDEILDDVDPEAKPDVAPTDD